MVSKKLFCTVVKQNGFRYADIAKLLKIKETTLLSRLNNSTFKSKDIEILLRVLDFGNINPYRVFFDTLENNLMENLNRIPV